MRFSALVAVGLLIGCMRMPATGLAAHRAQSASSNSAATEFSEEDAATVLEGLRAALETHDERMFLKQFSPTMRGYAAFGDQTRGFFVAYVNFRVGYRILQTWNENGRGVVTVQFDLQAEAAGAGAAPITKSAQLRFEMISDSKGWKIISMRPGDFFS